MQNVVIIWGLMMSLVFGQMTGRQIMEKVDAWPEPKSMVAKTTMTLISIKRGREKKRVREITRYQRNFDEGKFKSKSLIRFLKPADVKGTGFLMWEYRENNKDDDQWLFLPALGKVKRIAAREKSENFMGSDFTYEDIGGRELNDDEYELLGEEEVNGIDCYKVQAIPKQKDTAYNKRIVWVDKNNFVMTKVQFYDKKNRLLKVLDFLKQHLDGNYWSVLKMKMENMQTEHKTVMEISDIQYDIGVKESFFTERYLKRVE